MDILLEYDFEICYRVGRIYGNVDVLLRIDYDVGIWSKLERKLVVVIIIVMYFKDL